VRNITVAVPDEVYQIARVYAASESHSQLHRTSQPTPQNRHKDRIKIHTETVKSSAITTKQTTSRKPQHRYSPAIQRCCDEEARNMLYGARTAALALGKYKKNRKKPVESLLASAKPTEYDLYRASCEEYRTGIRKL
jgi:hypothetical protein